MKVERHKEQRARDACGGFAVFRSLSPLFLSYRRPTGTPASPGRAIGPGPEEGEREKRRAYVCQRRRREESAVSQPCRDASPPTPAHARAARRLISSSRIHTWMLFTVSTAGIPQ